MRGPSGGGAGDPLGSADGGILGPLGAAAGQGLTPRRGFSRRGWAELRPPGAAHPGWCGGPCWAGAAVGLSPWSRCCWAAAAGLARASVRARR